MQGVITPEVLMFPDKTAFHQAADQVLARVLDACDTQLADGSEGDLAGGILTIDTPQGQYILNKHALTEQLWLSSPRSGAWHFEWHDGIWQGTRHPQTLPEILGSELGLELELS